MHLELSQSVTAPPEAVWSILTDIPAAPANIAGIMSVEPLTPGPYAPGYRWRETRRMFGMKASEELMVTVADAPHTTTVVATNGGTEYETVFTITPTASGCDLTVRFDAETAHAPAAGRVVMALFGGIAERSTRKTLAHDLADIAAAAENIHL